MRAHMFMRLTVICTPLRISAIKGGEVIDLEARMRVKIQGGLPILSVTLG